MRHHQRSQTFSSHPSCKAVHPTCPHPPPKPSPPSHPPETQRFYLGASSRRKALPAPSISLGNAVFCPLMPEADGNTQPARSGGRGATAFDPAEDPHLLFKKSALMMKLKATNKRKKTRSRDKLFPSPRGGCGWVPTGVVPTGPPYVTLHVHITRGAQREQCQLFCSVNLASCFTLDRAPARYGSQ